MSDDKKISQLIHDLKNPLTGMVDSLEYISDMYADQEDLKEATKIIDQTCKKILINWDNLNNFLNEGHQL
jgi:nitrogen-specific signal transduction histidine kinase